MAAHRFVAFLRAINVGGRTVKMARLRSIFESLGFANVETFIASGNVVLETGESDQCGLEHRIEDQLRISLGYEVATFLRRTADLDAIVSKAPSRGPDSTDQASMSVIFMREPLDDHLATSLLEFRTDLDDLHIQGSEIYWLCRQSVRESTISGARIEKLLKAPVTVRNINTVTRLATKFGQRD